MAKKQLDDFWEVPDLSQEDQILVQTYIQIGKPLDQLPYTKDFDELVQKLGGEQSADRKSQIFQRLLQLRKNGRLPRIGKFGVEY